MSDPITDAAETPAEGLGTGTAEHLTRLADTGKSAAIDLRNLPMTAGDRKDLERVLRRGEVTATCRWRASTTSGRRALPVSGACAHLTSDGGVAAETIEITTVPDLLAANASDIATAAKNLAQTLRQGTSGPGAPPNEGTKRRRDMSELLTLGKAKAARHLATRLAETRGDLASVRALPPMASRAAVDALAAAPSQSVIWLSFRECTGCSESLTRSFRLTIEELISLDCHETLMAGIDVRSTTRADSRKVPTTRGAQQLVPVRVALQGSGDLRRLRNDETERRRQLSDPVRAWLPGIFGTDFRDHGRFCQPLSSAVMGNRALIGRAAVAGVAAGAISAVLTRKRRADASRATPTATPSPTMDKETRP